MPPKMTDALTHVLDYHERSKHHLNRYASGPGGLDWATQPDPFRRYAGAPVMALKHLAPGDHPLYESVFREGALPVQPLNLAALSQLFYDSLALSAWKMAGDIRWPLRVNPSSGNLHPTEGYLICGSVEGLCAKPAVFHYAPREHALERRAEFAPETWKALTAGLPEGTILVGLTSIHWREAWKYGERAYRYCQHDAGHAIAAVTLAAAAMGWKATLLDDLSTASLASLLGVSDPRGAEPEEPDCLLAVYPQGKSGPVPAFPEDGVAAFPSLSWEGTPNRLSPAHIDWPVIDQAAAAARRPATPSGYEPSGSIAKRRDIDSGSASFRKTVHQRRSCLALDGRTGITREAFYQILEKLVPGPDRIPFNTFPWRPFLHLGFFVHRVQDLDPGLYFLVRDPARIDAFKEAMKKEFEWESPPGCPGGLGFYRLAAGDAQALSRQISCHQEIASDGCFSLGMIAEFEAPLRKHGAWLYPRLFWEAGAIGQVLYLEAETCGLRGTGIGCFFDESMHRVLGLTDRRFQDLYHFTIGGPVEDQRLTTLPAYPPT